MKEYTRNIIERKCSKCGKIFVPAPFHVYEDNERLYCSWSCYNHRKERKHKGVKRVSQYGTDGEFIRTYTSAVQAAEHIGCEVKSMRYAISKQTVLFGYYWKYEDEVKHESKS